MPTATMPRGPRGGFITGHLKPFRADPLGFLTRCARDCGDFVPLRVGTKRILLVSDPAAIEEVLLTKSRDFIKHFGLKQTRHLLGNGLLTSEGEFWLRQRRLEQPAFHRDRIQQYAQVMIDHSRLMLAGWKDGGRRDLVVEMMELTLKIAAKTLFDAEETGDAAIIREQLTQSIKLFNQRFIKLIRFPLSWPTPHNLKVKRISRELNRIIYKYIERRRREGVGNRQDLLSILLHARDETGDGSGMTDAQLRDELMTLFLAGQETTALALSWTWYLLMLDPEVETKLLDEIQKVLGDRPLAVADVPRLKYAEAVINESLRLHPPAYVLGREAIRDVEIGGYRVPKGWTVFMAQSVCHRDPRRWHEPEKFRPERWLDGSLKNLPKFAFFPFGGGPRICIGNTFAMMETVIALVEVIRRFHFERTENVPIDPVPSITVRPSRPLTVVLHQRV